MGNKEHKSKEHQINVVNEMPEIENKQKIEIVLQGIIMDAMRGEIDGALVVTFKDDEVTGWTSPTGLNPGPTGLNPLVVLGGLEVVKSCLIGGTYTTGATLKEVEQEN
jgi:hypothetical protein